MTKDHKSSKHILKKSCVEKAWFEKDQRLIYILWALTRILMLWAAIFAHPEGDVGIYFRYAGKVLAGQVPYLDFTIEYPPGMIPFIVLPKVIASSLFGYRIFFALEMMLVDLLCFCIIHVYLRRRVVDAFQRLMAHMLYIFLPMILFSVPYGRYDLVPMACTLACMWYWRDNKPLLAWICLGWGFAIKLYPLVLLPLLGVIAFRQRSLRDLVTGLSAFAATVAVMWLPYAALAGLNVWVFLSYHAQRGIQIESLYANLVMMARPFGYPVETVFSYCSMNLVAAITPGLAKVSLIFGALVYSIVLCYVWKVCRRPDWNGDDLPRLVSLALLGFILTGKVFSPQYLLWVVPFIALALPTVAQPKRIFFLTILIFGLTASVFPFSYGGLLKFKTLPWLLLTFRNLLLVMLFILFFQSALSKSTTENTDKSRHHGLHQRGT